MRVDVEIDNHARRIHYEVELRPNIRKLQLKAAKHRRMGYRTGYHLVVPLVEFRKRDWSCLRGSFDKVHCFDTDEMRFIEVYDTRIFGGLQDAVLDSFIVKAWNESYWFRVRVMRRPVRYVRKAQWCTRCIQGKMSSPACWRTKFCVLNNLYTRLGITDP